MIDKKNTTRELHADSYDESKDKDTALETSNQTETVEPKHNPIDSNRYGEEDDNELDSGAPEVVQNGKKSKILIVIIVLIAAYFLFNIITSSQKEDRIEQALKDRKEKIYVEDATSEVASAEIPEDEEEEFIIPPKPPEEIAISPPSSLVLDPIPTYEDSSSSSSESQDQLNARVRANMNVFSAASSGGLGSVFGSSDGQDESLPNVFLSTTSSPNVTVTRTYKLTNTILQGKMIDAILETAIDTELQGLLRAVVSRDVYSEKGRNILIPRGSRLIGSYSTDISTGQARVNMIWSRLIRPDGLDAQIGSPATDTMGRAGVLGQTDRKFLPTIANAFLSTTLTVGLAAAVQSALDGAGISQTENTSGSINTAGDITELAALNGINSFSDLIRNLITSRLQVQPTINVEQGTRLKIYINKDVIFPDSVINSVSYVN